MRFIISFLFTAGAWAATPINVFHEAGTDSASMIKQILMRDYQIPEELIGVREVRNCAAVKRRGRLDLCLKNNGDLFVVSVDREFVSESLKIFKAP